MKTSVASITASIQDMNFLQAWMMTSLSRSVITSAVMTLREARVIWGHLLTSLSTTHHIKGCNLLSWEATFPPTNGPSGWPSASPGCAWQWGHPHGQNTAICHSSCLSFHPVWKIFSSEKKIIWFGLGGLLLVRKCFSKAARVAFSADMFLKIKTVCLLDVIAEMLSF